MWSDYVSDGKDSWGVYDPQGREEIFKLIEENNIGGVLLISGDYAFGEFDFDATLPDPAVTFRLIHENGIIWYEITLLHSELTP